MELNFLCSIQCVTEKSAATEDSAPGDKELVELDRLAGGGVHADGDVCGALGTLLLPTQHCLAVSLIFHFYSFNIYNNK